MQRPTATSATPLDRFELNFESLEGNWLGDPSKRLVEVWKPEGVATKGLPLLICLASYLNSGPSLTAWRLFGETIPERLDRIYNEGILPPCVVVFVDSFNRLGGTQFVNSPVMGNWVEALADELLPAIEKKYDCGGKGNRGLFGHSSGGFGALYNLAERPDIWSAAASHAGDVGFDFVYRNDLPKTLRVLSGYDNDIAKFLEAFWQQEKPKGEQISALMMLAMAASYDPSNDENAPYGIRLPVTWDTCEFIPERWEKWLSFDPIQFMEEKADTFKSAHAVYIDCGRQDEYNMLYGSRRVSKSLTKAGVAHTYEEFEGRHGTIGPRYETSLPILIKAMSKQ
ncbi:MAG: alpha/beta hydrolase-fold protein [Hyphomicrobiales bacterium]